MKRIAAVLLAGFAGVAGLAGPALAQNQPGNIEQVETPQGTVTIVRPTPRAQPAPGPAVNPDPVPPPPVTPFLTDQDGSRYVAPASPYPYVVTTPPVVIIQRRRAPVEQVQDPRRFEGVGPVPPLTPYEPRRLQQPGAPMQSRDGYGRALPSPRYPYNQYGPGAVPGTVPLPDAGSTIVIVPR